MPYSWGNYWYNQINATNQTQEEVDILRVRSYLHQRNKWIFLQWIFLLMSMSVFTTRNGNSGKVMFSQACVKHYVHMGGVYPKECWDAHPTRQTPPGQTPPQHYGIRSTSILLECILVCLVVYTIWSYFVNALPSYVSIQCELTLFMKCTGYSQVIFYSLWFRAESDWT